MPHSPSRETPRAPRIDLSKFRKQNNKGRFWVLHIRYPELVIGIGALGLAIKLLVLVRQWETTLPHLPPLRKDPTRLRS